MDPITQQTVLAAAGGAGGAGEYVDDLFSTYLHEGVNSSSTINNGIDLSGEGGLVWVKSRTVTYNHWAFDTERGATKQLAFSLTNSEATEAKSVTAFNSNGFNIGGSGGDCGYNCSGSDFVYWTFRKCPGFFDIVTYTGNSTTGHTINHNLGSVPGCIIIKRLDTATNWAVYHRGVPGAAGKKLYLNTDRAAGSDNWWNNTAPTATSFQLSSDSTVNADNETHVAYIFAHDDQSFGDDGDESIIKCGSYTCDSSGGVAPIDLGFEPQWLLIKKITDDGDNKDWVLVDNMRRWTADGGANWLQPSDNSAENSADTLVKLNSTGFQPHNSSLVQDPNDTYIYIAIRRPHKPLETAAKCFDVFSQAGSNSTQLRPGTSGSGVADMAIIKNRTSATDWVLGTRLLGAKNLIPNSTAAVGTSKFGTSVNVWDQMSGTELQGAISGTNEASRNYINYHFARKPGFFDVVAYAGHQYRDASTNISSVPHNLGVVPEMIWIKSRTLSGSNSKWVVYHKDLGTSSFGILNDSGTPVGTNYFLGNTPTNSVFKLFAGGFSTVDTSGNDYVAYLFATLPGVSKVGSYTGTGSDLNIDCGFTNGARFVLIKRGDDPGDWFVWDTARGIVAGNDPYLRFNSSGSAVTNTDSIDPLNAGFTVTSSASDDLNASGGTYIFYAIA